MRRRSLTVFKSADLYTLYSHDRPFERINDYILNNVLRTSSLDADALFLYLQKCQSCMNHLLRNDIYKKSLRGGKAVMSGLNVPRERYN